MNVIDLGCTLLRVPYLEPFMTLAGYFGHGSVGAIASLLLLAHGYFYNNQRTKRAGIAVAIALILAGTAAQVIKEAVQWPRPKNVSTQGFPSGHTSAAFAFAAVLTATFPAYGPIFYLLAALTAISRLYVRAHFTWDVLGGAMVGLLAGVPTARKLILSEQSTDHHRTLRFAGWTGVVVAGIGGMAFFTSAEKNIRSHMVDAVAAQTETAITTLDFGTAQARDSLRYGWSVDELWLEGKQSVVWASGLASELILNLPEVRDYRVRLNVFPYSPSGPACQAIEVRINDSQVSRLFLEKGWHSYEFTLPKALARAGRNSVQFFYNYSETPQSRSRSADKRSLSVAFDRLDVLSTR